MERAIAIIGVLVVMWFYAQRQLSFQDAMVILMSLLVVLEALKKR